MTQTRRTTVVLKAIYIGDKNIWDFMKDQIRLYWDWQIPITSLEEYRDALDNGKIESPSVLIISSQFYKYAIENKNQEELDDFIDLIYTSSKTIPVMVLDFWPKVQSMISTDLVAYAIEHDDANDSDILKRYWSISPISPLPDLASALRDYVNSPHANPDVLNEISRAEHLHPTTGSSNDETSVKSNQNRERSDDQEWGYDHAPTSKGTAWEIINNEQEDTMSGEADHNDHEGNGQIITVTSSKGGTGKTTISISLGQWISLSSIKSAQKGPIPEPLKVCVVDFDVHNSQIGTVIGKWQPTILEVVLKGVTEDALEHAIVHDGRSQCDFLLSPKLPSAADAIPLHLYRKILGTLRKMYDVVVVDTSIDYTGDLLREVVYPMSDQIIFVTTLDRKSVMNMRRWIVSVVAPKDEGGVGVDLARVSVVINRGQKSVDMTRREIEDSIRTSTQKAYQQLDMTIPVEDQPVPKLIGVIPDIPNGLVMKSQNELLPVLALMIPPFEKSVAECANKIVPIQYRGELPNLTSQDIVLTAFTLFNHDDYDATWDSGSISDSDMGIDEDEDVDETEDLNDSQTGSNAPVMLDDSFEDYETITEDPDDDDSEESTEDEPDGSSLKFEEVTVVHNDDDDEEDDGPDPGSGASEDEEPIDNAIAPKDDDLDLNGESGTDADETETVKHDESQYGGWEEVFRR